MPSPRRFRLSALLAGASIVAASLLPAFPAAAEEPPTPDPVVTAEPTPEPTPTAEPTPDPTPTPEATAEPTPTPEPTPEPSPQPTSDANTVEYAGTFNAIAVETGGETSSLRLFQVNGYGFLAVDTTGFSPSALFGTQVMTAEVPAGLTLSSDTETRFRQLAKASTMTPLTLISTRIGLVLEKPTAALVNQTPNAAAEHRIYAVLVSPNSKSKAANQTAAKVATSVAHADSYWGEQSGDTIGFTLAGTVPWYSSSYSCKTESGSVSLWNQAASVAKSKLGYVAGKNNHLVLFFPSNIDCAGNIGLGSVGVTANTGGVAWVRGTDLPVEQASLAHELGHNMSLGHADWILCSSATPNPGFFGTTGCVKNDYGDATDVMGFGTTGKTGGALSAPQAIRAGIWPSNAWETMLAGTTTRTINTVASNTGLRGLVVQDDNGVNYFIEYRNFDDEDAQYLGGSCTASCVAPTGGVRVMRLENTGYKFASIPNGFLGFPGDDSYLMGRTISSVPTSNLTNGQFWWSKGSLGIKVTVTGVTSTTATVQIIKPVEAPVTDPIFLVAPTSTYDDSYRVGDTWTAFAGGTDVTELATYQWFRGSTPTSVTTAIPGATGPNYTMTSSDLGMYIRVVLKHNGTIVIGDPVNAGEGYGPIVTGKYLVDQPGTVSINNSATPLVATPASWPVGTTYAYQWYRGSTASTATTAISGSGANTAFYTPTSADSGKFLRVKVTATVPGYSPVSRYSAAKNYSMTRTGTATISGTLKVGAHLTVDASGLAYTTFSGLIAPDTFSYQWLRNGSPISGSDASDDYDYDVQSADYGQAISVRITAVAGGWVSNVYKTGSKTITAKGTFSNGSTPTLSDPSPTLLLTLTSSLGDTSPAATSKTIQWYRNGVAVTDKTAATYQLGSADFDKIISVKVTYKKSNYTSLVRTATYAAGTANFSVGTVTPGTMTGDQVVDNSGSTTLTATPGTYESRVDSTSLPTSLPGNPQIQWLRDGVPIPGAIFDTYNPDEVADLGKKISVRFTMVANGLLQNVQTTPATQPLGDTLLDNYASLIHVDIDPGGTETKTVLHVVDDMVVGPAPVTTTYQWFRDSVAITDATKVTYQLTAADAGHLIKARVTTKKAPVNGDTYTTVVKYSSGHDYSILPDPVNGPYLSSSGWRVGDGAGIYGLNFVDSGNAPISTPTIAYQWYVGGVLVPGATSPGFAIPASAYGKKVTIRLTVTEPNYIPLVYYPNQPYLIEKGITTDDGSVTVDPGAGLGTLTATIAPPTPLYPPATYKYQWYRDDPLTVTPPAPITDATSATYKLVSADYKRTITVKVTMVRTNFTVPSTALGVPTAVDYSIRGDVTPVLPTGTTSVGQTLHATEPQFFEADGTTPLATTPTYSYKWYSGTTLLKTTTVPDLVLSSSYLGMHIRVKVTAALPGRLARTSGYSPATAAIVTGTIVPGAYQPIVTMTNTSTRTLKVSFTGTPTIPASGGFTATYKWYREGSATAISTTSSYNLVSADTGKAITVVVKISKSGYHSYTFSAVLANGILQNEAAITQVNGNNVSTATTGDQLNVVAPQYYLQEKYPDWDVNDTIRTYQWYRDDDSTPIVGENNYYYNVVAGDLGHNIYAKVTVTAPYHVTVVETTNQIAVS